MKLKKLASAAVAVSMMVCQLTALNTTAGAEGKSMNLTIDGSKAITAENKLYRGLGMVSGNNSSRLLLDYKAENPKRYNEILNYLFGADGIGITHLKLEMGADINSSSGTEPAVMRHEDEKADVTRGAGFQLAADAKKINPDLTLDMLWWSEPLWVSNAEDVYAARYKWYKNTLDAAYETYGLTFDYVSANQNERRIDADWIKYLSSHLKSETDCPYDYSKIKIVAADEVGTWGIGAKMLKDEELLNAVDVIGGHYTDWTNAKIKELAADYGKEVWFSEGSSPMSYSNGTYKYDGTGTGLTDINGVLDVANRIITMFPGGDMTLYEFQPAVSAYYVGVTYCQKQLITAEKPWSGYYTLDSGFYMSLHFSQFFKKGWCFIDGACAGDGKAGGDGHAIVDAVYSYMTATDSDSGDYSTVITNTTDSEITYNITVKNLDKAGESVCVFETRGPGSGVYDENYFKKIDTITPQKSGDSYTYSVTVKPYSMVTLSTLNVAEKEYTAPTDDSVLALPYSDNYEYSDYPENYLASRGGAPRYTTDEGGAFEVQNIDGNNVLMQIITPETKANEWGSTPDPVTNFGDDRWFNYSVSADVKFSVSNEPDKNYTGVGMRYNLADAGKSGYWVQLYEDGSWKLNHNSQSVAKGTLDGFDNAAWTELKISAEENKITAYANGALLCEYNCEGEDNTSEAMHASGRAALYSSYNQNCFDNVKIEAVGDTPYIKRIDDTDDNLTYSGEAIHTTMSSFKNYNRTITELEAGAVANIEFKGSGFAVVGGVDDGCKVKIEIDGTVAEKEYAVPKSSNRECTYYNYGLSDENHTVKITVLEGKYAVDAVEVSTAEIRPASDAPEQTESTESEGESSESSPTESGAAESDLPQSAAGNTSSDSNKGNNNNNIIPIIIGVGAVAVAGAAIGTVIAVKKKKKNK